MERHHPVFHLLLPKTVITEALSKLKFPQRCKLVGIWKKSSSSIFKLDSYLSSSSTAKERKLQFRPIDTVTLTIFGLQFDKNSPTDHMRRQDFTVNGNPNFQIIGEIVTSGRTSEFSAESVELPPLWITLAIDKNKRILVEQICLDNLMLLPEPESIVIIEYNPEWLKYCVKSEKTAVQPILSEAFQVSHLFPSDNKHVRLLPDVEEPEEGCIDNCEIKNPSYALISKVEDFFQNISKRSLGLKQVIQKATLVAEISHCKRRIKFLNLLLVILIDSFLGALLTWHLLQYPNLFSVLHVKIDAVVKLLQQLLQWLRGSPAGFKLNDALNSLLWRFFSYHLHLWGNYIGMLQPILSLILTMVIQVGVLGITVQIALIKDLLSVTTFHMYCLYIYASRLFAIQLRALKSLGRLFYGRKWNPLRNRVDSIQLSTSEMFVSSLVFTIAIFLAPTTIIYYIVFLSLRLPVLITESVLTYVVMTMNSLQLATSILVVTNSPRVANEIYLQPVYKNGIATFEVCIQTNRKVFHLPNIFNLVGKAFRKIIQGELL